RDSAEFEAIKREVMALPVVKAPGPSSGPPPAPSRNLVEYRSASYELSVPENWKKYEQNGGETFAPEGGVSQNGALAYGLIVSISQIQVDANDSAALDNLTRSLIQSLAKTNPGLRVARDPSRVKLNGRAGLSTYLTNDSP